MTNSEFDYEMHPDCISEELYGLESSVWDRGYYCETEEDAGKVGRSYC
jgi:hypothetical protein